MTQINHEKITFLNFDGTLRSQESLQKFPHHWIDMTDIYHTNGYCERQSLKEIHNRLTEQPTFLHFIGNGNYHYVTYLLLKQQRQPFSLVLFDHHSDLIKEGEMMSCGSWVMHAINDNPYLKKVLIIGVNDQDAAKSTTQFKSSKIHIIYESQLQNTSLYQLMNEARQFLQDEKNLYISIDKDVLYKAEVVTTWDQGSMSLVQLIYILKELNKYYRITGLDVCGEYRMDYTNQFDPHALERVKMNEIVNRAILEFVVDSGMYVQPKETSPQVS